jgi:exopolysaccharide production protein ExoQ
MKPLERLFHIVALALQCGAGLPLLFSLSEESAPLGAANPWNTMANSFVLVGVIVLVTCNRAAVWRVAPALSLIFLLVLLAFASTIWSDYPDITIRKAGALLTTTTWAWYVAARFDLKEIIRLISNTIGIMAIASLFVGIFAPDLGQAGQLDPEGWRGIFSQKNNLGDIMAIGLLTYFYLIVSSRFRLLDFGFRLAGLVMCALLLILSQSRTSWVIGLIGVPITLVLQLVKGRAGIGAAVSWIAIMLLLPAMAFVEQGISAIAPLLGRSANLTGRTELWAAVLTCVRDHPLLGYGLGAFWVEDSRNVLYVWSTIHWHPPTAHNGWLDLLLELGWLGAALLTIQVGMIFIRGMRAVLKNSFPDSPYLLLMLSVALIHNLSESELLRPQSIMWILIVVSTTALAKVRHLPPVAALNTEQRTLRSSMLAARELPPLARSR